ncbi:MAG: hypothetical protein ACRD3W_29875, partial [Terriglobales bacterium]
GTGSVSESAFVQSARSTTKGFAEEYPVLEEYACRERRSGTSPGIRIRTGTSAGISAGSKGRTDHTSPVNALSDKQTLTNRLVT